jgi:site-specific recombinase XerD
MSFADLVDQFLDTLSSSHTRRAYRADLRRFFSASGVDRDRVAAIDPDAVQAFVRAMKRRGRSLATQRRRLAALRGFFDWLIEDGRLDHNPGRSPIVTPLAPGTDVEERPTPDKAEVERLLDTAKALPQTGLRDQALIATIVYGALRRREVAGLTVDDVRPLGRHWIVDVPGDSENGYVRIPEAVVNMIDQMQETYRIATGRLWRSLSNQNRGEPLSPDGVYKAVRRVAERAGLDPVSIDGLRRAGLQLAMDGGADLAQIQVHGRFSSAASAAQLTDASDVPGALNESAVDHIDLDL